MHDPIRLRVAAHSQRYRFHREAVMGILVFADRDILVDDRALAHLQIVIIDKFRRNEKFSMSLSSVAM